MFNSSRPPDEGSELHVSPAGFINNQIYVTLAAPVGTAYHTLIDLSTTTSLYDEVTTAAKVVEYTYSVFQTRAVHAVQPAFAPTGTPSDIEYLNSAQPLHYYNDWNMFIGTYQTLLAIGDGPCGAWAQLFRNSLRMHGDIGGQVVKIESVRGSKYEGFAVNDWELIGSGSGTDPNYPYRNFLRLDGKMWDKVGGEYKYLWHGNPAPEFTDLSGTPGQGPVSNPQSLFENHQLVKIDNKYYDPSYGTGPWDGLVEWEDGSIAAYITADTSKLGHTDARKNVIEIDFPSEVDEEVIS